MGSDSREKYAWKGLPLAMNNQEVQNALHRYSQDEYPPHPWQRVAKGTGLLVWRVKDYRVYPQSDEEYGHFYEEDVYILLSSQLGHPMDDKIVWNLHLWLGRYASQIDYQVAALKVAELDEVLHQEALLHRHVQGRESELFKSYFNPICVWKGSSDGRYTGHGSYPARLLKFYKPDIRRNSTRIKEISIEKRRLDQGGVFVMDLGHQLYLWVGCACQADNRIQATRFVELLRANRGLSSRMDMLEEVHLTPNHPFHIYFKTNQKLQDSDADSDADSEVKVGTMQRRDGIRLHSIKSKHNKRASFKTINTRAVSRADLEKQELCILDSDLECFVWVGRHAHHNQEKRLALEYAHEFLMNNKNPFKPVTVVTQGQACAPLERALNS